MAWSDSDHDVGASPPAWKMLLLNSLLQRLAHVGFKPGAAQGFFYRQASKWCQLFVSIEKSALTILDTSQLFVSASNEELTPHLPVEI